MTYSVKEIYYTLQGEGAQSGRAAVFLRFAGCNLWTGREKDRATAACDFCDTDFVGTGGPGGTIDAEVPVDHGADVDDLRGAPQAPDNLLGIVPRPGRRRPVWH